MKRISRASLRVKTVLSSQFKGAGFLVVSLALANFLNFVFNAYLGRELTFEDYGLITFFTSLIYLVSVLITALGTTVNFRVAFLNGQMGQSVSNKFYSFVFKRSILFSTIAMIAWALATPFLMQFFNVGISLPILAFAPVLLFAILLTVSRGYLQGSVFFIATGLTIIFEAAAKLALAIGFVSLGLNSLTYMTIPFSILSALIFAQIVVAIKNRNLKNVEAKPSVVRAFPRRFLAASIFSGLASVAFLTLDVILVKHYLNPSIAGQYALLSLVGKMIFFLGTLFNGVLLTLVSREEGLQKNTVSTFYKIFALSLGTVIISYLALGPLGYIVVPILFGAKAQAIVPYLFTYTSAIAMLTLSAVIINYHLAKRHYTFQMVSLFYAFMMIVSIVVKHESIAQIANIIFVIGLLNFATTVFLHLIYRDRQFILANILDLFDLFSKDQFKGGDPSQKRILIFNWRDTKHVFGGGAEVYIHELAKRWVRDGHHVTVFCGNDGRNPRYELIDGVEIVRRGGFYFVYIWAFFYYLIKFRGKYDFIIDCENGIPFFAPLYAKEPIFCVIHHIHQEVFKTYNKKLNKQYLMAKLAAVLENRVMPWAYKNVQFITVSQSSKEEMEALDLVGKGIRIIHNGVDLESLHPGTKSKDPTILYLGRLKHIKSIDVLIRSFNRVVRKLPKAKLIIAGSGEDEPKLRKLVDELGLENYVSFVGRVSNRQKSISTKKPGSSLTPP
jgi:O-antigen/teichoic acid export membrane protein